MPWPTWSIDERATLARYVTPEIANQLRLDIARDDALARDDRIAVVRAIYCALEARNIHYSREPWAPEGAPQIIRDPELIFRGGNATCLDLALLFAGACLGHELLPLVCIVDGHAFVAISLLDDPRAPTSSSRIARDGPWVADGLLTDHSAFQKLISESGHYIPIECTGFATKLSSSQGTNGFNHTGALTFDAAIEAARAILASHKFLFAVDPAVRQRVKLAYPYETAAVVEDIANRVQSLFVEEHALQQHQNDQAFEADYLKQVVKKYGRVETLGVRDLKEFRQSLTIAYVSLFIKRVDAGNERGRKQAEYVLKSEPLLTVRAAAGAGKTTLLNWIASACGQGAAPEANLRWKGGIPFFVHLRALKATGIPEIGQFVDYTIDHKQWPVMPPDNWIVKILSAKRAVVMLDGVDELPPNSRGDFWKWIREELIERYPGNRVLITSRYLPESRTTNWQPPPGFASADLDEMTDSDVHEFVRRWHNGALEFEKDAIVRTGLEGARDSLPRKLDDPVNYRVRELCGTPLLCSMICALHWREEGYLPGHRIELYERCVDMLIEERDRKRGIEAPEGALQWLKKSDKEMLLQRLAYQMMKNVVAGEEREARIEVSKDQAERWIAGWRPHFEIDLARAAEPSDIIDHLIERSGLVREPVSGTIEYAHRSFQEYLAACAAGAADDAVDLARRANDDQWHEIIILASGTKTGGVPFGKRLIQTLLRAGERRSFSFFRSTVDLRHTYLALAVACLGTAKQPDPDISQRVLSYLKEIVPPKDAAAAKHLSAAGEAALPFLVYGRWKEEDGMVVASCARAVRLIGGPSARKLLVEGYANDERAEVLSEVVRSQDITVFDLPSTKASLLRGRPIPHDLGLFVSDLRPLAQWILATSNERPEQKIDTLDLFDCEQITDISALTHLSGIKRFRTPRAFEGVDISPLADWRELETLVLASGWHTDLSLLKTLQGLKHLVIWHADGRRGLEMLSGLPHLQTLKLPFCEGLRHFGDLAFNDSLRYLDYFSAEGYRPRDHFIRSNLLGMQIARRLIGRHSSVERPFLFDFGSIGLMTGLTYLGLRGNSIEVKLPQLDALTRLQSLNVSHWTELSDISRLTSCKTLQHLELTGCSMLEDISPLAAMPNLRTLRVPGATMIRSFAPLQKLQLHSLEVDFRHHELLGSSAPSLLGITRVTSPSSFYAFDDGWAANLRPA